MLEASQSTPPQRVKVYRLNNEGKWDDKGTGHVTIQLLEVVCWMGWDEWDDDVLDCTVVL